MPFQFETRSVEDMGNQLIRLYSANVEPKVFFDSRWACFRGSAEGEKLEVRATEIAELTVQEHGSAYRDYQSTSDAPVRKVVLYVGGRNNNKDILIVGETIELDGNLSLPAYVSLQDLIGYRTIEEMPAPKRTR